MRRISTGVALSGLLLGSTVWAQDNAATDQNVNAPTTTATETAVTQGALSKVGGRSYSPSGFDRL